MKKKQLINLAQRMVPLNPPMGKFSTPTKLTPEGMMARANATPKRRRRK